MSSKLGPPEARLWTILGPIWNVLPATLPPPFRSLERSDGLLLPGTSAYTASPLKSIISTLMAAGLREVFVFFLLLVVFFNHVPHRIRQKVYTFYWNNVFCKPISCKIVINSYFKASKGSDFFSGSSSI